MNWGILATGNISNRFAKTILAMEENGEEQKLIACASRDIDKAKAFGALYNIENCYGSYHEMVQNPDIDCIYIATPNNMHYDNCKMCLNAGKHVLCEKPFTLRTSEAAELYELAREKGLFIMEGFWIRFLPALIELQSLLKNKVIGDVIYARSDYGFIAKGARRERKFLAELGGGALLDIGIYNLGFMYLVMQDENPVGYTSEYHLNEYGTDDFSTITLKYESGATATVATSIGIDMPRKAVIYGSNGRIELDDFQKAESIRVYVNDSEEEVLDFPIAYGGFEYEIREMCDCINKGQAESSILRHENSMDVLSLMEKILDDWNVKFDV